MMHSAAEEIGSVSTMPTMTPTAMPMSSGARCMELLMRSPSQIMASLI